MKPEWNIKFTCVEPGGFRYGLRVLLVRSQAFVDGDRRTDWAGRSMAFAEERHPAYDHLNAKEAMGQRNGKQGGDPEKGAQASRYDHILGGYMVWDFC